MSENLHSHFVLIFILTFAAVDINIKKSSDSGGVKQQKIHFVKKGK